MGGEELGKRIREEIEDIEEKIGEGHKDKRGWWDDECRKRKKEVRKELREWRKKGGEGGVYKKKKKDYKELCERKKKEENERWEKKAREVKREGDVWELLNKERRKRRGINEGIDQEKWKEYFMDLLGGVETRVRLGGGREGGEENGMEDDEKDITREEVKGALKRLKDGKAMGMDGIPEEAWKYGGETLESWVKDYCNEVWRRGG